MNWGRLRQQGSLTLSIVLCAGVLLMMLIPALDLRGALMVVAILALLLGWVP